LALAKLELALNVWMLVLASNPPHCYPPATSPEGKSRSYRGLSLYVVALRSPNLSLTCSPTVCRSASKI